MMKSLCLGALLASACGTIVEKPAPLEDAAVGGGEDADSGIVTRPVGEGCNVSADCESGTCSEGICCATECDGECARCDLAGHEGTCTPVPSGTQCGDSTCSTGMERPAPQCDGAGTCIANQAESCGRYVCEDASSCFVGCTDDSACSTGNVCAGGECAPPSCTDGVKTAPETDIDCGGAACPKCRGSRTCAGNSDCQSGTCASGLCTTPTYTWRTSSFGSCGGSSCGVGQQTRTVWCERSDGTTVSDDLCTAARPASSQTCTNTAGCSWFTGQYGSCSVRCGGGTQTRSVYCKDTAGTPVPNNWCSGTMPTTTVGGCNPQVCVRYVVGEPTAAMGPCWGPNSSGVATCNGGYAPAPACPAGYVATRTEQACGNPNSPGGNWALQIFLQTVHYGCANANYVMGITSRECTWP